MKLYGRIGDGLLSQGFFKTRMIISYGILKLIVILGINFLRSMQIKELTILKKMRKEGSDGNIYEERNINCI